jgi:hypothetical protein
MGNYANKIRHLYTSAITDDFSLVDAGEGVYIEFWNIEKLGVEPTLASLDAQISDAEIEAKMMWRKIRKERNQLLKDSDYTMLKDYPTTVSEQEWTTYRQSLRDIPQTFSNPDDVTYPDKPE